MLKNFSKKKIIVIVLLVCVIMLGGILGSSYLKHLHTNEKNIYIALQYLNEGDHELGSVYLDKVDGALTKKMNFAKDSAEVIRQQIIGNRTLSTITLELLNDNYSLNETQSAIVKHLEDEVGATEGYTNLVTEIINLMKIPNSRKEKYQLQYEVESSAMNNGYLAEEQSEVYLSMNSEADKRNLSISVALSSGDYYTALREGIDLVRKKPLAENKLLLADIIARASYAGYEVDDYLFLNDREMIDEESVITKERDKIVKKIEKLNAEIVSLDFKIETETDGKKTTKLSEKRFELAESLNELQNKSDKIMAYKAINSISNIPGVEADIMEAKLYYVVGQEEEAMKKLVDTSDSLAAKLNNNDTLTAGLNLISGLYNGSVSEQVSISEQANVLISNMLNTTSSGVVVKENSYSAQLVKDMSNAVLAEYKYLSNDIYITSFDDTEYPKISMTVSSKQEILNDILEKKDIVMKDTHHEVDYEATVDMEDTRLSVCFVVDTSGSMSGTPINDAKEALNTFVRTLDENTEISLVHFESFGEIVTPITTDVNKFVTGVESLYDGGGTEISEGIRYGIEALKEGTGMKNMILMTDGQSDVNYEIVEQAAEESVSIYTVGFGDVNTQLLTEIAEKTGGHFTLADSSDDLEHVYESIGIIMGNRIQVTYTVTENVDEPSRYAFIRSEKYNSSRRHDYGSDIKTNSTMADNFYVNNALAYDLQSLNWYADENGYIDADFDTSNNMGVTSVEIDGNTLSTEASDYRVTVNMPAFTEKGMYDVKFNLADGSSYTAENVVLVYDGNEEGKVYRYIKARIGSVVMNTNLAVVNDDGTIAMVGATFQEHQQDGNMEGTLRTQTQNMVVFDHCAVSENMLEDLRTYNWGESGQFHMDGVIEVTGYDAQAIYGSHAVSSIGKLSGVIDGFQCTITAR